MRFQTVVFAVCVGLARAAAAEDAVVFKFDFGSGPVAPGYTAVTPATVYSKALGYGLDLGTTATAEDRGGSDPVRRDFLTSATPFYFSVDVPEGNYRVSVTLGDAAGESVTTIKAESRRLMVEKAVTARGQFRTETFTVNVRNSKVPAPPPNAPGNDHVELSSREQTPDGPVLHWDDKLTLEFSNSRPCVAAVEIVRVDDAITVFLAGDSTVTDQTREPGASWGQMLTRFFTADVAVANHAESGETLKSFITELRLDKVLSQIKGGDYLFIQFGHNDSKVQWPQTYVEAFTTYKGYLKVFVAEARRRGAVPVLLTPMQRRQFDAEGRIQNSHGDYPEAMRQVAREEHVALIDLTSTSVAFYEALGPERAPLAFSAGGRDATHHDNYGAYELARCVIEGIKASGLDLARFIAKDVAPFDPARPDPPETFALPASPGRAPR